MADGTDCSDCVWNEKCLRSNPEMMMNDCWNSIDLDFYSEIVEGKDKEALWLEMTHHRILKKSPDSSYEKTEEEIELKNKEKYE